MTSSLPSAVLWDLDGTLVDTEPDWIACERVLVESYGGTWTDADSLALIGSDLLTAGAHIRDQGSVPLTPEKIVEWMLDEMVERVRGSVRWRPGAHELLTELRSAGVPCALVTMSYRRLVDVVLADLPDDTFGAVVTGDEVVNGKPHPEPYLTAAALLGVEPQDCVVIEDSSTGVAAGLAAGSRVLAVPHVVSIDSTLRASVLPSLVGLRPLDLAAAAGYGRADRGSPAHSRRT